MIINNACLNKYNPSTFESIEDYGGIYADQLMKDNIIGIGIYSCPDFQLIKANQKYEYFIQKIKSTNGNTRIIINNSIAEAKETDMESLLNNTVEEKKTIYLEEIKTISDGDEIHYWKGHLTPIIKDGNTNKIIFAIYETTEQNLKMKQMELKNEELREATEIQNEFLTLVTHELKTPLSVIAATLQTIELRCRNELSNRMIKYLNKIKQNTYRQLKLVNDILDNTRINSGLFKLNIIRVDIIHLSRTLIESISTIAESKGITVSFYSPIKKLVIETDINLYERILLNLLSNAVKYTPPGKSVEVNIFQAEANGVNKVYIQVKDNGIGIPTDKKELIFERFRRVEKFDDRFAGGTGIGLYLVKALVSMIDGEIMLESKEGIGSIFTLILPYNDANINMSVIDTIIMENANEHLIAAANIEFSDIHYGS